MNMKKILLIFYIITLPLFVNAQREDSTKQNKDWKFAAGVTLYSNNHYVWNENVIERQPLEFNFRYKIKNHHVLRLALPISWKVNKAGEPEFPNQRYPTYEVTLEDYLEKLHEQDYIYANYYKILQFYESLYGVSLGYDYNYSFGKYLSLFGGIDFAYNHLQVDVKYYNIFYMGLDENGKSELGNISVNKLRHGRVGYSIKPLVGFRLNFQKLLFEANLGYMVVKSDFFYNLSGSAIGKEGIIYDINLPTKWTNYVKYFMYNFSLYYTF